MWKYSHQRKPLGKTCGSLWSWNIHSFIFKRKTTYSINRSLYYILCLGNHLQHRKGNWETVWLYEVSFQTSNQKIWDPVLILSLTSRVILYRPSLSLSFSICKKYGDWTRWSLIFLPILISQVFFKTDNVRLLRCLILLYVQGVYRYLFMRYSFPLMHFQSYHICSQKKNGTSVWVLVLFRDGGSSMILWLYGFSYDFMDILMLR